MKKLIVIFMLVLSIITSVAVVPFATAEPSTLSEIPKEGQIVVEENTGDFNRIPVNNDILYPLSCGVGGRITVDDYNKDGYLDIHGNASAYGDRGNWTFYGTPESQNPESPNYLVMEGRRKISDFYFTEDGPRLVYDDQGNFLYTTNAGEGYVSYGDKVIYPDFSEIYNPTEIEGDLVTGARTINFPDKRISGMALRILVDFDNDGLDDIVYGIDDWGSKVSESGDIKLDKWSDDGVWGDDNQDGVVDERDPDRDTNGDGKIDAFDDNVGDGDNDPPHGWVMFLKNLGTNNAPVYDTSPKPIQMWDYTVDSNGKKIPIEGTNRAIDNLLGGPTPVLNDFDGDKDLDLVLGSFVGYITYYENIGDLNNPIYAVGERLKTKDGKEIVSDNHSANIQNCDWNKDGLMDIILSPKETGRVYLLAHTGKFFENGMPIFTKPQSFFAPGDSVRIECLASPYSVDWDEDGDEDLMVGDSGGFITYVRNLTIEKALEKNPNANIDEIDLTNPSWDTPYRMRTPDDEEYAIRARYNGSPQGPTEELYGYSYITVADWDGDGVLDVIHNNVLGLVLWHKGIKGDPYHFGYQQPIDVEWSSATPKPYWWTPKGDNLVVRWRSTVNVIDIPLDEDGDGTAEGDGLLDIVLMDHEGYVSFYRRFRDRDGSLKVKEGKRIFYCNGVPWYLDQGDQGKEGIRLVDWDCDGDLDALTTGSYHNGNAYFYENISQVAGEYNFVNRGDVHPRALVDHETHIAFCDWNKDGVPDMIFGDISGSLYYLENSKCSLWNKE